MFLPFFQPIQEHYQHFLRLGRGSRVRKELEAHTADKIGSHVTNCDELAKLYATYRLDWSSKAYQLSKLYIIMHIAHHQDLI